MNVKETIKRILMGKYFSVVEHERAGAVTIRICTSDSLLESQEIRIVNYQKYIARLEKQLGIASRSLTAEERAYLGGM